MGVDPGRDNILLATSSVDADGVCSGVTSLKVSGCDCDFSRTPGTAGNEVACTTGVVLTFSVAAVRPASAAGVPSKSAQAMTVSQDGRKITVVSSCSVCEVRVDSRRCLPDGVTYRSSIFSSSWLVPVILDTSCDNHVFQSLLERVEFVRRGGDGVPTTKLRTEWLANITAEPSCRSWWTSLGLPNDMTLSFGSILMPSVFREYTLGDNGDMIGLGDGVGATGASGRSVRATSICSMIVRDASPETARLEKLATLYTRSVSRGN